MNILPTLQDLGLNGKLKRLDIRDLDETLSIWFSYETPVAFNLNGNLKVSANKWGSVTGKHLNHIDGGDKEARLPREEFEEAFAQL